MQKYRTIRAVGKGSFGKAFLVERKADKVHKNSAFLLFMYIMHLYVMCYHRFCRKILS